MLDLRERKDLVELEYFHVTPVNLGFIWTKPEVIVELKPRLFS